MKAAGQKGRVRGQPNSLVRPGSASFATRKRKLRPQEGSSPEGSGKVGRSGRTCQSKGAGVLGDTKENRIVPYGNGGAAVSRNGV